MSRSSPEPSGARRLAALAAAAVLIVLGGMLVLLALSPTVQTRVLTSERDPASGVSQIVISAPDGVMATWPSYSGAPGVGAAVAAVRLPNGALVDPSWTGVGRDTGAILVALGVLIGIRIWWRAGHPNPPNKTLVTTGDSVVLPPIKAPGGGMG